jgi:hypothetical protein
MGSRDLSGNVACHLFGSPLPSHQSVIFSRTFIRHAAFIRGPRSSIMIGLVRAAAFCATLALGLSTALGADKAFKRDDLG